MKTSTQWPWKFSISGSATFNLGTNAVDVVEILATIAIVVNVAVEEKNRRVSGQFGFRYVGNVLTEVRMISDTASVRTYIGAA